MAFRRACRAYAEKYVDIQRKEFKRLGVLGDWDDPYLTMDAVVPGRRSCASWRRSSRRASSTRRRSPCTGASRAAPRWPRPRSNTTRHTSARRSTCASALGDGGARAAGRALPALSAASGVDAVDLDDDALDAAGEPRPRVPSRRRLRRSTRSRARRRPAWSRRPCADARLRAALAEGRAASRPRRAARARRRARRWRACASAIPGSTATRRRCWATTSRSTPAPASCTRRPATAGTTT